MDQRDSHCPYLLSSETTAKGTGLAESAGKEDPVELDSSLTFGKDIGGVASWGVSAPVKSHYSYCFFTYSKKRRWIYVQLLVLRSFAGRAGLKTLSGGEFGWGGPSVKP